MIFAKNFVHLVVNSFTTKFTKKTDYFCYNKRDFASLKTVGKFHSQVFVFYFKHITKRICMCIGNYAVKDTVFNFTDFFKGFQHLLHLFAFNIGKATIPQKAGVIVLTQLNKIFISSLVKFLRIPLSLVIIFSTSFFFLSCSKSIFSSTLFFVMNL